MKPNFALTLSFDGIGLLHRVHSGWHLVGEVGLSSDDLNGEMAVLRRTAQQLDSSGLTCKLVIPNEQIRYLTIDTPAADDAARARAAREALDGATPYSVEQLRLDWIAEGDHTHVAAVAKETLEEAEAFAAEHRFGPASFVATPPEGAFVGEVYFGPCAHAKESVERDSDPIQIVGMAHLPAAGAPPPNQGDAPEKPSVPALEASRSADKPAQKSAPEKAPTGKKSSAKDKNTSSPEASAPAVPAFSSRRQATGGDTSKGVDPAIVARTLMAKAAPRLTFGLRSSSSKRAAPKAAGKRATLKKQATAAPVAEPAASGQDAKASAPAKTSRSPRADRPANGAGLTKSARTLRARTTDAGKSALLAATQPLHTAKTNAKQGALRVRRATKGGLDRVKSKLARGGELTRRRPKTAATNEAISSRQRSVTAGQTPQNEEQQMTIFGARRADSPGHAAISGPKRNIGLIAASGLLLVLAGVGVWATVYSGNDAPALFEDQALTQEQPDTDEEVAALAPPPDDTQETAPPPAPLRPQKEAAAPTPDAEQPAQSTAAKEAPQSESEIDQGPQQATSLVPRPDEAMARYAATGIWPAAPKAPEAPQVDPLEGIFSTSTDPRVNTSDAVALPSAEMMQTDPRPSPQTAPAIPGTRFDLDDRGLVTATPEGTISPEGVMIYTGPPPAEPPRLRTSDTRAQDALRERLSDVRPKIRPEDLIAEDERSELDVGEDTALASIAPKPRPTSIAALARTNAAEETTRAADVSLKPALRPNDLSTEATPITTSAVAPEIPTSSSVAKQATVENAMQMRQINLIGVYGKPSSRRALIRLPNGQFKKVEVGDSLDGGRVAAIGERELRYIKSGRNLTLKMPRS